MIDRLRRETRAARELAAGLDRQMGVVLTCAVVFVLLQLQVGSRRVYWDRIAEHVPVALQDVGAWAWWFGFQGLTGFVLPVLVLALGFRRSAREMGLGLGDWRLAGTLAALYLPLVVVGTWVLSSGADFQDQYPHFDGAEVSWALFFAYEALYLFYWVGWEYLWRGFVLFGTAPALGAAGAIVVQMVPFALLHASKPAAEAYLSIVGGLALGWLVWRCRSFWIAVPIHAAQMFALDFWCTLRARSGAQGIGLDALADALGSAF